jgi:hypothetical protein
MEEAEVWPLLTYLTALCGGLEIVKHLHSRRSRTIPMCLYSIRRRYADDRRPELQAMHAQLQAASILKVISLLQGRGCEIFLRIDALHFANLRTFD